MFNSSNWKERSRRDVPRTQTRSSGFESDWSELSSTLGIMGKAKRKKPFPASFASTLNFPIVHRAILLDRLQSRFTFTIKHLRRK